MANLWGYNPTTDKWEKITKTTAGNSTCIDTVIRGSDGSITAPVDSGVATIIDNASFTETVEGADIDFSKYRHAILSIKTGTATTSPTLTVKIQIKDSNDNYIDHTTLTAISTATTVIEELFYLSAETIRVVCTFGGTGSFAATTVELTMKS